jgi:flagellar basal body P-ring protein FlgI
MSSKTRISPIALAHGSIVIKIVEEPRVFMPNVAADSNIYNKNTYNATLGQNSFESGASKIVALKAVQAEEMKLLEQNQANEMETEKAAQAKDTSNPEANKAKIAELQTKQEADKLKLVQKFNQQIEEAQRAATSNQSITQGVPQNNLPGGAANLPNNQNGGLNAQIAGPNGPVVTSDTKVNVREDKGKFSLLSSGASIDKLVNALNQLGVSVKVMGDILMAMNKAGALHAQIKIG